MELKILWLFIIMLNSYAAFAQSQMIILKAGGSATLQANGQSAEELSYQWFKDGLPIPGAFQNKYIATEPGLYSVWTTNSINCTSVMSMGIILKIAADSPPLDLEVFKSSESKTTGIGEPFDYTIKIRNPGPGEANLVNITDVLPSELELMEILQPLHGTVQYIKENRTIKWTINQFSPGTASLKFKVRSLIAGIVKNAAIISAYEADPNPTNNTAVDEKEITDLKIPNVFSPNGDGVNDRFKIAGLELFPENEFTVINRWGSHVFEKKQYQDEWTGDGLNEGTYFYVLRLKRLNGEWQVLKGYITLLRSK